MHHRQAYHEKPHSFPWKVWVGNSSDVAHHVLERFGERSVALPPAMEMPGGMLSDLAESIRV